MGYREQVEKEQEQELGLAHVQEERRELLLGPREGNRPME